MNGIAQRSDMVRFAHRFVGPYPGWANGGVIAGTLADRLGERASTAVEVRIDRPVPTDSDLEIVTSPGAVGLRRDGEHLAAAQVVDAEVAATVAATPGMAARTTPLLDPRAHPAPGCFVCGPDHPDGLNLQPGAVDGTSFLATTWLPDGHLAGADGRLPPPLVWAALDCPSWFAATQGEVALLGTVIGRQHAPVLADQPVVVTSWPIANSGRKHRAGTALHDFDGELLAVAHSLWISPKGP